MNLGLLLIALGFGYKVWLVASEQKGNVRMLGRLIAVIMVLFSAVALGQFAQCFGTSCPLMGKGKGACPMMSNASSTDTSAMPMSMGKK